MRKPADPNRARQLTQPVEKLDEASLAERDQRQRDEKGVTERSPMRLRMEAFIQEQQRLIVAELARVDGSAFREDHWTRAGGGGGISCVLQDGRVFEKAGVNTSVVYGRLPPAAIAQMRVHHPTMDPDADGLDFFAAGLSMVLHPHNPHAPTVHLNYRYFETSHDDGRPAGWWFGGGTDLTPAYLEEDDVRHFHAVIKAACDRHDAGYYPRFKRWCDDYFTVRHRAESRGVGGIFFDDLDGAADDDGQSKDQDQLFRFVQDCCTAFLPSYLPILRRRIHTPFTPHEKEWQQLRRGRYVEFNLVHDRGTSFGLHTPGARVESILVSLPLTAKWMYMHEPEPGSREERLLRVLRQPVDWA
ncbi:MAG: Coproporphyrinogen-III oxidase [Phylliscum demangeonii]|nr:MAG: Coproporphyrinogen-III oxidase [Phylliscum demangeonii]